jgi:hypothetical protein
MEIEFKAPQGLEIPEGTNPGDSFEVMATVTLGEEGELYLKELDGISVSGEEDPEEDAAEGETEPSENQGGFLEAMDRRMEE